MTNITGTLKLSTRAWPRGHARMALWLIAVFVSALGAATPLLSVLDADRTELPLAAAMLASVTAIAPAGLASLIAHRQPGNRIAWALLAVGMSSGANWLSLAYLDWALLPESGYRAGGAVASVISNEVVWLPAFCSLAALLILFPDGVLPTPSWRAPVGFACFVLPLACVMALVSPGPLAGPYEPYDNPLGLPIGLSADILRTLGDFTLLGLLVAAAVSLRRRARSADGIERQQLRWLALLGLLVPFTVGTCVIVGYALGAIDVGVALGVLVLAAGVLVPSAVAVAVLRYRLYSVDRWISRTLIYVPLTGILAGCWGGIAVGVGSATGRESPALVVTTTLVCALVFQPLRRRLQLLVDRRFNSPRQEAVRRIDRFVYAVREGRARPEAVEDELAAALGDRRLALRYRLVGGAGYVDRDGRSVSPIPGEGLAATVVERRGIELGILVHDPLLDEREELLHAALGSAALAIEVARLRADVGIQVKAVRRSREELAVAELAERAHVRSELERGAGARLNALHAALDKVRCELPDDEQGVAVALAEVRDQLGHVRGELSALTAGFPPAALERGLPMALHALAEQTPAEVDIDARADVMSLPDSIQRMAYFVAAEAVTNAIKHACATRITISASLAGRELILRVIDDGRGGAGFVEGGGLDGLRERVDAIGGTFELCSAPGGTTVQAVFQCAS